MTAAARVGEEQSGWPRQAVLRGGTAGWRNHSSHDTVGHPPAGWRRWRRRWPGGAGPGSGAAAVTRTQHRILPKSTKDKANSLAR